MAVVERVRNTATPRQVAQIMCDCMPSRDEGRLTASVHGSFDEFLDRNSEFVVKLLQCTPRPTAKLVKAATRLAFEFADEGAIVAFASVTVRAVAHARRAMRGTTSGRRIPPATLRAGKATQRGMGQFAARSLQRRRSEASSVAVVPSQASAADSLLQIMEDMEASPMEIELISSDEELAGTAGGDKRAAILASYLGQPASSSEDPPAAVLSMSDDGEFLQYLASDGLVRTFKDGTVVKAVMTPGPDGFAIGTFPGEEGQATEMPNLALPGASAARPPARAKASAAVPAVAVPQPAPETPETPAPETPQEGQPKEVLRRPAAAPVAKYRVMRYKRLGSFAVRRVGGAQLFSIAKKGAEEALLREVADAALRQLAAGVAEETVREWARAEVARRV